MEDVDPDEIAFKIAVDDGTVTITLACPAHGVETYIVPASHLHKLAGVVFALAVKHDGPQAIVDINMEARALTATMTAITAEYPDGVPDDVKKFDRIQAQARKKMN